MAWGFVFLALNVILACVNIASKQYYLLPLNAVGIVFAFASIFMRSR